MYVLDKLWRGELSPSEPCVKYGSEYSEIRHKATQLSSQLVSRLSASASAMNWLMWL